ncbi:MAG: ester cyclase, partial [Hymenobacter sp.]
MDAISSLQPLSAAELQAVRSLYQAFSDNNPDLVDQAVSPTWQDIPLG